MSAACRCEQCGFGFRPKRPHARFCSQECRRQGWIEREVLAGLERVQTGSRRLSRDGHGTRVYLTAEEIALVGRAIQALAPAPTSRLAQFLAKLHRASDRISGVE